MKKASLKFTVQPKLYKTKKPLKIKRLTTVLVHQIDLFSNQTIKFFEIKNNKLMQDFCLVANYIERPLYFNNIKGL